MKKLLLLIPIILASTCAIKAIDIPEFKFEPIDIPKFEFEIPDYTYETFISNQKKLHKQSKKYNDRVTPIINNHAKTSPHCLQFLKLLTENLRKNRLMLDEATFAKCIKDFDFDELLPRQDERIMGPNESDLTEEVKTVILQLTEPIKEYDGTLLSQLADKLDEL
jgi:hypothetical protein